MREEGRHTLQKKEAKKGWRQQENKERIKKDGQENRLGKIQADIKKREKVTERRKKQKIKKTESVEEVEQEATRLSL